MNDIDTKYMSPRELIEEFSQVARNLRRARKPDAGSASVAISDEVLVSLVHREQQIVHELKQRAKAHSVGLRTGRPNPRFRHRDSSVSG